MAGQRMSGAHGVRFPNLPHDLLFYGLLRSGLKQYPRIRLIPVGRQNQIKPSYVAGMVLSPFSVTFSHVIHAGNDLFFESKPVLEFLGMGV